MRYAHLRPAALVPLVGAMACVCFLAGCGLDQEGMVLLADRSYRATVIGTSKDGFVLPDGILWRQGRLLMADEGGAVRLWGSARDNTTLCDRSLSIGEPEDLVVDDAGNVFFTDDNAGGVWEIPVNGHPFLLAGGKDLVSTEGIALTPSGDLLVGDGHRHHVCRVDRAGHVSIFLGPQRGITKPESMVYDDKGNLYIADNEDQVLYLLTPKKDLLRVIDHRDGFSPETIWYADHVLYITDSKNGKLSRYTPEHGLHNIAVFGGKLKGVCGITTDDHGNIFVSIQSYVGDRRGYIIKLEHETPEAAVARRS
jgi:sugar lactone lactonase YvrE